jgi:hypothetical protein
MKRFIALIVSFSLLSSIIPQTASARPLSESEGIYFGTATSMLTVAITSLSDIVILYENPEPTEDDWWFELAAEFGTLISLSESGFDSAPRVFRSSNQLFKQRIADIGDIGREGLAAVIARDEDAFEDTVRSFLLLNDDLQELTESLQEDLAWIREVDAEMDVQDESDAQGETASTPGRPESNNNQSNDSQPTSSSSNGRTIKGKGSTVSDSFRLSAGRYKVTARVEVDGFDGFAVWIYGAGDFKDLLFNDVIDESGTWTSSQVFETDGGGSFYVETTNTDSSWTLTFEKM